MKIKYLDTPNNIDIYLEDQPECKVKAIFHDSGDIFLYYSHNPSSQIFINRVINYNYFPHVFFLSNLDVIKDNEQFDYYYKKLNSLTNYQGLHKDEDLTDGTDITFPSFGVDDE